MTGSEEQLKQRRVTFVQDACHRLMTLSESLLALERDPVDQPAREEALRALHTLKGNAGLVGLETIAAAAHKMEDALADPQHVPASLLLRGLDALSAMVVTVAESVGLPGPPIPVLEAVKSVSDVGARAQTGDGRRPVPAKGKHVHDGLLSTSVRHLDSLLELTEELRMAQSEMAGAPRAMLERHIARQRRLLHELHNTVLQTRLLPVARAFAGFQRLVRDLAQRMERRAMLVIEGAHVEIDRSALEPVRDLTIHLLRNALAHGIEPPQERQALGKPPQGAIRITARQEGDGVVIEVSDDGRGLDRQRVVQRAVALGLCSAEEAAAMENDRLWDLLTQPGFSTHGHVDRLAGRGMGLSAVRQGVAALRGRLEIESQPGEGACVRLRLPAMMALEEVVLLRVGGETYAVPESCVEVVRPADGESDIPTIDLWRALHVPVDAPPAARTLIVCQRAHGPVGLLADGMVGRETAIVKPLPSRTRRRNLLGAIVTGAGRVVLVLDIEYLDLTPRQSP